MQTASNELPNDLSLVTACELSGYLFMQSRLCQESY